MWSVFFPVQVYGRRVWWSMEWRSATHLVLPPGEGDICGEYASWFGLLDHFGRFEKAPASAFGARDHSVCWKSFAVTSGQLAALWTTGSNHPCIFSALTMPRYCRSSRCSWCFCLVAPFLVPSSAKASARSLPGTSQWAGIHCRTSLLVPTTWCLLLDRRKSLLFRYACSRYSRRFGKVCAAW